MSIIFTDWLILTYFDPKHPMFGAPCGFKPSGAQLRSDEEDRWAARASRGEVGIRTIHYSHLTVG